MLRHAGVNENHSNKNANLLLFFDILKKSVGFFLKERINSLPSVKSQRSHEWNAFGIAEETPFKLALLELPIVTILTMYNNKHSPTSNYARITRNSKSTALPMSINSPPKPSFAASVAKISQHWNSHLTICYRSMQLVLKPCISPRNYSKQRQHQKLHRDRSQRVELSPSLGSTSVWTQ